MKIEPLYSCSEIKNALEKINEWVRLEAEYKEQAFAEIIENYDFVTGSYECKQKLMEILPDGANVVCSPYIENPTMIYAIKKFDIAELIIEPQEEMEDKG